MLAPSAVSPWHSLCNPKEACFTSTGLPAMSATLVCRHPAAALLGVSGDGERSEAMVTLRGDGVVCYHISTQASDHCSPRRLGGRAACRCWRPPQARVQGSL